MADEDPVAPLLQSVVDVPRAEGHREGGPRRGHPRMLRQILTAVLAPFRHALPDMLTGEVEGEGSTVSSNVHHEMPAEARRENAITRLLATMPRVHCNSAIAFSADMGSLALACGGLAGVIYLSIKGDESSVCSPRYQHHNVVTTVISLLPLVFSIWACYFSFLHVDDGWCTVPALTAMQMFVITLLSGWVAGCLASVSVGTVIIIMIGVAMACCLSWIFMVYGGAADEEH